jgi:hypothetical protein
MRQVRLLTTYNICIILQGIKVNGVDFFYGVEGIKLAEQSL